MWQGMAALDKLEGHPHRYERRRTDVRVTSGNARDGTPINKAVENDDPAALGEANGNFVKTTNCIRNLPLDVSNDVTTKIDGQVRITAGQVISAHTYFLVAYQPHLLALPHLVSYDGGFVTPPADASDDLRRETFLQNDYIICSSSHCVNTFFVTVNGGGGGGGGGSSSSSSITIPILKNDQMGKGNLALAVNMGLIYRSDLESLL
ncbi:hypothetical protein DPMN_079695 [Dreissena polymorpha]|uniref:Uncharacterized protein n=1 Tax=Dreissena polymorpha TaxID=45954 RepID=A0A9D3YU83_DREPO|nr:hypothetical protein DPMN_079695 [Dreissena polymorpha]